MDVESKQGHDDLDSGSGSVVERERSQIMRGSCEEDIPFELTVPSFRLSAEFLSSVCTAERRLTWCG